MSSQMRTDVIANLKWYSLYTVLLPYHYYILQVVQSAMHGFFHMVGHHASRIELVIDHFPHKENSLESQV